jgi:O-acetyl-ADP-ribose deacetylase (regulator of RNase III)
MPSEPRTCFVIMPFGKKADGDGRELDFDLVYRDVIQEPLETLGLVYERCDDIQKAGLIHQDMFQHIAADDVAIVDITTLNANVFYELGARHALRPGVTVLIRHRGTTPVPFNISGLRVIEYPAENGSYRESRDRIRRFVEEGLKGAEPDSPIFALARGRQARDKGQRIVRLQEWPYALRQDARRRITLLTGDIGERRTLDVWVNSENTNMQMARFYDRGMSALIRYLGAKKDENQNIIEDTIANELAALMRGRESVAPGTVYATSAGALEQSHGVKQIFHAAAVVGTPGAGYLPIPDIDRCVTACLRLADCEPMRRRALRSIAFPLFGTGTGGGDVQATAGRLIQAGISYLTTNLDTVSRTCASSPGTRTTSRPARPCSTRRKRPAGSDAGHRPQLRVQPGRCSGARLPLTA